MDFEVFACGLFQVKSQREVGFLGGWTFSFSQILWVASKNSSWAFGDRSWLPSSGKERLLGLMASLRELE